MVSFVRLLTLWTVIGLASAADAEERTPVEDPNAAVLKQRLADFFAVCQAEDLVRAADFVVYRGRDEARRWKDVCDPTKPDERRDVAGICQRIVHLTRQATRHEYLRFYREPESEGEWNVWQLHFFVEGRPPKKASFAFLLVKGRWAIGDID